VLVLGVCSLKGGVGKTSVTLGLASAALARELRTLVIDLDPQADATVGLGAGDADRLDVAAVLDDPRAVTIERAIAPSGWAQTGLDVMRGSARSATHDGPGGGADVDRLGSVRAFLGGYDLVLVDCPPSLGTLTRAGLTACDRAVVVTEPGLFAVMAVGRALRTIDELRRGSAHRLQPLGIIVNRVGRSAEQVFRLAELQELYGLLVLSPTVPERACVQQAQGAARAVHSWPGAPAAALSAVFDQLLEQVLRAPRS
jgi:chromosome partitioning protein